MADTRGSIGVVPAAVDPKCYDERMIEEAPCGGHAEDVTVGGLVLSVPDTESWEEKAAEEVIQVVSSSDNSTVTNVRITPEVIYERRIEQFLAKIADNEDKFNLVVLALKGKILEGTFKTALDKVTGRKGESDFCIISLIRMLYLCDSKIPEIASAKQQIESALDAFPFWPTNEPNQPCMDKIIFWSENHLFMTLGSCYLFRQYKLCPNAKEADEDTKLVILQELNSQLETKLLKIYMRAHCCPAFNGVYEVNSSVYLPYTISGLMNLHDFSLDEEVKQMAKQIIDRAVFHVLLCTTSNGTSNLCAGGRTFVRTRLRTHGHNINQLVNVLIGKSPDTMWPSAITDFVLTTTWRPNYKEVQDALEFCGTHEPVPLSHSTSLTREIYKRLAEEPELRVDPDELVPLYWSAGLITNPDFVTETKNYLIKKHMSKNESLSAMSSWSAGYLQGKMEHYHTLSTGQTYTGFTLNVYKEPARQLVLSSFERFNPHASSFQQLPWIANVSGVGVWTQAGSGSEGFLHFGMTNTHNPLITQKGSVLVASHVAPVSLTGWLIFGSVFSSAVRLYWPVPLFDESLSFNATSPALFTSGTHPAATSPMVMHNTVAKLNEVVQHPRVWVAGRRGEAYIGVCCTQRTKMDHRATKDAEMKEKNDSKGVHAPRRICREYRHSWIVVVGTRRDYPTLREFIAKRCLSMEIVETNGGSAWVSSGSLYTIEVHDTVEGELLTSIELPTGAQRK